MTGNAQRLIEIGSEQRGAFIPAHPRQLASTGFNVGIVQDHVAPWRSVFKLHALTNTDQTFVLSAGGHNVGVVNPPGDPRASYRICHWRSGSRRMTPDEWLAVTRPIDGSWRSAWVGWLAERSTGRRAPRRWARRVRASRRWMRHRGGMCIGGDGARDARWG